MATIAQNIFLTKKEKLKCKCCGNAVLKGQAFVAESETAKGTCFDCSPFAGYTLLPPGDAALTRRSKKHSDICGVLLTWNQRRKRFERKGQYVQADAISKAKVECVADEAKRALKNKKAAEVRVVQDREYILEFALAIKRRYVNCPQGRELDIAEHACEKYSGRVGRTANAKLFDAKMIDLAVEAHIRHTETNYDNQFGKGKKKVEIRSDVKSTINAVMFRWKGL